MKFKKYLNAFLAVLGFGFIGWISFLYPNWLLAIGIFTAIPGYFLLLLCFIPAGSICLGSSQHKIPLGRWLLKLCLGQIGLAILTVAATVAFMGAGPTFVEQGIISLSLATAVIQDYSRWQWGIFPWGVIGLWGIIIAYLTYVKKGMPFLFQIARNTFPKWFEPMIKTYVEATCSGATIMALTLVACAIILLVSYVVEVLLHINHFIVPVITVVVLSFIAPITTLKSGRKYFRKLGARKISLLQFYTIIMVMLTAALIFAAFANVWVVQHLTDPVLTKCEECAAYFASISWEVRFAAMYWGWWLLWTPLAGSYLAKISEGRTLREFVLGLYLVPGLLFIAGGLWGLKPLLWLINAMRLLPVSIILFLLAIFSGYIFFRLLKGEKSITLFQTGYLRVAQSGNRLWLKDPSKKSGLSHFLPRLMMSVLGTLFLHTMAGWYGIQIQVAAMAVLVINAVYVAFDLLIVWFFRDKAWVGNQNILPFKGATMPVEKENPD